MNNTEKGYIFESQICDYLSCRSFKIIKRNYRCIYGEIDIIAELKNSLHIIEVKHIPYNWEITEVVKKVNFSKQCRIKRTCNVYLANESDKKYNEIVFDVACVAGSEIYFWEGAFQ